MYQRIETEMSGISDAIHNHTQQMREAADHARAQQAAIFRRMKKNNVNNCLKAVVVRKNSQKTASMAFFPIAGIHQSK